MECFPNKIFYELFPGVIKLDYMQRYRDRERKEIRKKKVRQKHGNKKKEKNEREKYDR